MSPLLHTRTQCVSSTRARRFDFLVAFPYQSAMRYRFALSAIYPVDTAASKHRDKRALRQTRRAIVVRIFN